MDAGLVCESTISAMIQGNGDQKKLVVGHSRGRPSKTHVMGFMKGTLTPTASATKFSTSRSMDSLYLDLTYSGLAAYRHATSPPNGVIPTRSPMPNTANDFNFR